MKQPCPPSHPRRGVLGGLALGLLLLVAGTLHAAPPPAAPSLAAAFARLGGDAERKRQLKALYAALGRPLLFVNDSRLDPAGEALVAFVAGIADHGLSPRVYEVADIAAAREGLRTPAATPSATATQAALAQALDLHLALAFSRLLSDFGRTARVTTDTLVAEVRAFRAAPQSWLGALPPAHPQYALLVRDFARYRALQRAGPAPTEARARLTAEGFLAGPAAQQPNAFDAALRAFQRARGLPESGTLDAATKAALGRPWSDALARLRLALRLWRASSTRGLKTYLRVNIPEYHTEFWVAGRLERGMRSIVGTAHRGQTPNLAADIEYMVLNPAWYVPPAVKRVDLDQRAARDPEFWTRFGFDLRKRPDGTVQAVQRPGPDNWLGRVIFKMRSGTNIFLHDTPRIERFNENRRTFSHGCVNVENATDLARRLLELDGQPDAAARIPQWLDERRTRRVPLNTPVPVRIEYIPVVAEAEGPPRFLPDVYRRAAPTRHDADLSDF